MKNFKKTKTVFWGMISLAFIFSVGCNKRENVKDENTGSNFEHSTYVKVTSAERKDIMNYQEFSGVLFSENSADIQKVILFKKMNCWRLWTALNMCRQKFNMKMWKRVIKECLS